VDFLIKYGEHNKKTPWRGVVDILLAQGLAPGLRPHRWNRQSGGGGEIRTHGWLAPSPVFKFGVGVLYATLDCCGKPYAPMQVKHLAVFAVFRKLP